MAANPAQPLGAAVKPGGPQVSAAASQTERAVQDIVQGARAMNLWGLLAWQDIRSRYRRSKLGPFWLTLSMGLLVSLLGLLYSTLFQVDLARYLPFLALGFIVWTLISNLMLEACRVFINAQSIITQMALPLSVHVYRLLWRCLIILAHNALIFVVIALALQIWPGWTGLLALPGLALLCLNGIWAALLLGLLSARFRDVPPIVESLMRIAFFVTPVMWMPEFLPRRVVLLELNPFFHCLEVVRAPLLGQAPALVSWLAVVGMAAAGWLATFLMYRRYRRHIAYWV